MTDGGTGQAAVPLARLRALRRLLIALIAPGEGPDAAALAGLTANEWRALARMAAQHRLQPLLHARRGDCAAIPESLRRSWHDVHRASGIEALIQKGELARTVALLERAGFAPLALKGAWLAWHAWPDPALRPLRDIDLLLDPETVIAAWKLLLAQGYSSDGPGEFTLEDAVRLDKHLPPLVSPRGVTVELHQRLWEIDGRMDHAAPRADEAAVRARAVRLAGISYPCAADMLAHLIIHAVYDHRLDVGPLLLGDIAALLARTGDSPGAGINWPGFWQAAQAAGWAEGAALVLALVQRFDPALPIRFGDVSPPPPALLEAAVDLMLQDLDTRRSAGVLATLGAAGPGALLRRLAARRAAPEGARPNGGPNGGSVARDLSGEGGFAAWARDRMGRTLGHLLRPDVRRQSRELAALSRWLDEG